MLRKPVDWSDIKHISIYEQLNLWYELVGTRNLYQPILSPFRADTNIGGNVYLDHYRGKIVLADFSCRDFHNIDIFNALITYHNWSFGQMCDYIKSKNQKLSFQHRIVEEIDKKCYITPNVLNGFYKPTIEYFNTYGISHKNLYDDGHLNADKIFVNRYNKIDKKRVIETWQMKTCHLIFKFKSGNMKLYQPLESDSRSRWCLSNTNKDDFFIIKGDKSSVTIGSCYKDVRVFINSLKLTGSGIARQNESLPKNVEEAFDWEWIFSHEKIYLTYDLDRAGEVFKQALINYISQHRELQVFEYPTNLPCKNAFNKTIKDVGELYRFDKTLICITK